MVKIILSVAVFVLVCIALAPTVAAAARGVAKAFMLING